MCYKPINYWDMSQFCQDLILKKIQGNQNLQQRQELKQKLPLQVYLVATVLPQPQAAVLHYENAEL